MSLSISRRSFHGATLAMLVNGAGIQASAQGEEQDLQSLDPKELNFSFVNPQADKATGFVVGGKNETAVIRKLTSLNGHSIADLEKVMRPDANFPQSSTAGFLGEKESLLEVLATDNDTVLNKLGKSHVELARPLLVMGYHAQQNAATKPVSITYNRQSFRVQATLTRGYQDSPFQDGTKANAEITLENLQTDSKVTYSLLVPHMIERYGFYEGTGTPYRVDPQAIAKVLRSGSQ